MKCHKCGAELSKGVLFCRECGSKVEAKKLFCRECGSALADGMGFCPNCGAKIELSNSTYSDRSSQKNNNTASAYRNTDRPIQNKRKHNTPTKSFFTGGNSKLIQIAGITSIVVLFIVCGIIFGQGKQKNSAVPDVKDASIITTIQEASHSIEKGSEYAWMSDTWNVYIATAISDSIIRIENWDKSSSSKKTMDYSNEIGSFKINDPENGFAWIDKEHTAFMFTFQDKDSIKINKPTSVIFTINISDSDKYKGTDYNEKIACYSFQNDDWHMYRVIPLTKTLAKIECWARSSSNDKFCFAWDVGVIDTNSADSDFEWTDDEKDSCTITMQDPKNDYYWKEPKFVAFMLENNKYKYSDVVSFLGQSTIEDSRSQKDGFDSANNEKYQLAGYVIEIPDYWKRENKIPNGIQRYAETGGKVALLQIAAQVETDSNCPVNFDSLVEDNENMIEGIEETAFSKVTNYEIIDTGSIKGILYTGIIEEAKYGISGYGEWFSFPSEIDNKWCSVIYCQSDNTDYLYGDDFMKMIQSIKPN